MSMRFLVSCACCAILVSGCAGQGEFPSLAPRAVERELSGAAVPPCATDPQQPALAAPPPPAPLPDDPRLRARITELAARARSGEREFNAALPAARAKVAQAGQAGSDPWIDAQIAVSRLEAARSATSTALAELDALATARAQDPNTNAADRERVVEAAEDVRRLAADQRSALEDLQRRLSAP